MIVPPKLKSDIQMALEKNEFDKKTREQAVKDLVIKGWSEESANIIIDQLESIYKHRKRST